MKLLKRAMPAAVVAALLLVGLAACSGSGSPASNSAGPSSAGSSAAIPLLRVGTTGGTSTLDPLTTQGCATDFCGLFMERLMKFSPDGKLEPPEPFEPPEPTGPDAGALELQAASAARARTAAAAAGTARLSSFI